ncbi:MAG: type III-B CRISPR module RAMP protein Cmr4 [Myxococcota bacterium]|nr:type III-B CRISPR module RAMP protein Cmr4 [Myxococcota bacterium]
MTSPNRLLTVHALTGVHPGSGTALGAVDLPIQRERHTDWPVISGSSIKGVLRDVARRRKMPRAELEAIFGSEPGAEKLSAGAVAITDARILAFPVRSLKGVFAWVTCPGVLERLARDLAAAGMESPPAWPKPAANHAAFADVLAVDGQVVFEEFDFARQVNTEQSRGEVAEWIAARMPNDKATQERFKDHLAILHDDDFTHFVRHGTEVVARIGLDHDTKTVKKGALFHQEFLPPETLVYGMILPTDERRKDGMKADQVSEKLAEHVAKGDFGVLQIGGDETIGKGICAVRFTGE